MIRHVAVFSWIPGATDEQKQRAAAGIATLPPLLPGLRSYLFGADAHLVEGNADFAIVADFEDADAYLAYRNHPAHVEVVKRAIQPIARQRLTIQIEI
jgi:hypothetical protein